MALIKLIITVVVWLAPAIVDAYIVLAIALIPVILRQRLLLLQDDFFFTADIAAGILPSSLAMLDEQCLLSSGFRTTSLNQIWQRCCSVDEWDVWIWSSTIVLDSRRVVFSVVH